MSFADNVFSDEFHGDGLSDFYTDEPEHSFLILDVSHDEDPDAFSNLSSVDELDETAIKEASEKLEVINLVGKNLSGGWTKKNIDPVIDNLLLSGSIAKRPSWRSVARWRSQYDASKGLVSLVARNKFKNRDKRGRSRKDTLIFQAIDEKYLTKERPSISAAYQYYCDLIEVNNKNVVSGRIGAVSYNTFRCAIKALSPYEAIKGRFGKRYADKHFRFCTKSLIC